MKGGGVQRVVLSDIKTYKIKKEMCGLMKEQTAKWNGTGRYDKEDIKNNWVKEDVQMTKNHRKDAPHHWPSGKSKP